MRLDESYCCEFYDDQDEISEQNDHNPELERELLFFATSFFGDLRYIVKKYITDFFRQESFHQGGKIPSCLLLSNSNISMVINYDITEGVNRAYDCLKDYDGLPTSSVNDVPGDIKLVITILSKLSSANIPQQFAGGMVLLYLKLVEGVDIGQ